MPEFWEGSFWVGEPQPPVIHPNVSPVYEAKNQTANRMGLTDEARQDLYNTPTNIQYVEQMPYDIPAGGMYYSNPVILPGVGATQYYAPSPQPIHVWSAPGWDRSEQTASTLGHEYLHKRYFEDLPAQTRNLWEGNHQYLAGAMPHATVRDHYENPTASMAPETYAYAAQDGPQPLMPEWAVQSFYPNTFKPHAPYVGPPGMQGYQEANAIINNDFGMYDAWQQPVMMDMPMRHGTHDVQTVEQWRNRQPVQLTPQFYVPQWGYMGEVRGG